MNHNKKNIDNEVDGVKLQEIWNPDAYILRVKIDSVEFQFQAPDRASLDSLGIELLARTFGRYNADEIRKKIKLVEKAE